MVTPYSCTTSAEVKFPSVLELRLTDKDLCESSLNNGPSDQVGNDVYTTPVMVRRMAVWFQVHVTDRYRLILEQCKQPEYPIRSL